MARITNALLGELAYSKGRRQPILDLTYGGQQGWSPNLKEWVSNQAYVRRNLICILLEAPKFFESMPDSEKWYSSLKSLFEVHCKSIDGFQSGLEVEFEEHNVGGAGEMQEEVTNVKRARSTPKFTFVEKYGKPIQALLYNWITYGLMDPETKYALVGTLEDEAKRPTDMLADWFTATILVFEPDPTHRKIVNAWLTTNIMPKGTGEIIGKRDITAASELLTLDIEFTGLTQTGLGVNVFAQKMLEEINITHANPYLKPAFIQSMDNIVNGKQPSVRAAQEGYEKNIEDLGGDAQSEFANTGL